MSKLYLKGVRNPITITLSQAVNLGKLFDDDNIRDTAKLNIGGTRFSKEDIKSIVEYDADDIKAEESDSKRSANDEYYSEVSKEYVREIAKLCDMPIADKVNDTRLYQLAWSGFTLIPMTQEYLDEVKSRQTIFFEKYPKHPYASINVADLLPRNKDVEASIKEITPNFVSRKVILILNEAFSTARAIHKI